MSSSVRKVLQQVYTESQDFRKRKFDISRYQSVVQQVEPVELIITTFREFSGNFARKLLLLTLKWWKKVDLEVFIQALNKVKDDELTVVYLVSFVKRYFDVDLSYLCQEKDLYLKSVDYFEKSVHWVLELERLGVDVQYLKDVKIKWNDIKTKKIEEHLNSIS
jgi:hypothetical protein